MIRIWQTRNKGEHRTLQIMYDDIYFIEAESWGFPGSLCKARRWEPLLRYVRTLQINTISLSQPIRT